MNLQKYLKPSVRCPNKTEVVHEILKSVTLECIALMLDHVNYFRGYKYDGFETRSFARLLLNLFWCEETLYKGVVFEKIDQIDEAHFLFFFSLLG
jgi:hypothetical protein